MSQVTSKGAKSLNAKVGWRDCTRQSELVLYMHTLEDKFIELFDSFGIPEFPTLISTGNLP